MWVMEFRDCRNKIANRRICITKQSQNEIPKSLRTISLSPSLSLSANVKTKPMNLTQQKKVPLRDGERFNMCVEIISVRFIVIFFLSFLLNVKTKIKILFSFLFTTRKKSNEIKQKIFSIFA
jgi:hypothetical protein